MSLLLCNSVENKGSLQISSVKITQQSTIGSAEQWKVSSDPRRHWGIIHHPGSKHPTEHVCPSCSPPQSGKRSSLNNSPTILNIDRAMTSWSLLHSTITFLTQAACSGVVGTWHTENEIGYVQSCYVSEKKSPPHLLLPGRSWVKGDRYPSVCN